MITSIENDGALDGYDLILSKKTKSKDRVRTNRRLWQRSYKEQNYVPQLQHNHKKILDLLCTRLCTFSKSHILCY